MRAVLCIKVAVSPPCNMPRCHVVESVLCDVQRCDHWGPYASRCGAAVYRNQEEDVLSWEIRGSQWFSVLCYPEASRSSLFKPCHRPLRGRLVLCSVIFHPHLTPRYTTPGTRREINDLRINLGCGKLSRTAAITRRQLCVLSNLLSWCEGVNGFFLLTVNCRWKVLRSAAAGYSYQQ